MHIATIKKNVVLLSCLFMISCSLDTPQPYIDKVTVQLAWQHQSQFAGFYAAYKNGFYRQENIQVKLRQKEKPPFDVVQGVAYGDVDFAVNYGIGLIKARGDTLFTSEIMISNNPDLVRRFTRATVRGWRWAFFTISLPLSQVGQADV